MSKEISFEEMLNMSCEARKEQKKALKPYIEPVKKLLPNGKKTSAVYINIPVLREYYCDDLITEDLDTALEHGWGEDGSRAFSFGYGNAFQKIDLDLLPEPEGNYSISIKKVGPWNYMLHYEDGMLFFRNDIYFFNDDFPETFNPGPISKPYEFLDQGTYVRIFEKDGYIVFLQGASPADNLHDYNRFTAFKAAKDRFQKAWGSKNWM